MKKLTIKKQYEVLYRAILKYGSVQVILAPDRSWYTEDRKRIITKDGKCKVSYWHSDKGGFTRKYYKSCFAMYAKKDFWWYSSSRDKAPKKHSVAKTLREMMKHDRGEFYIKEVKVKPEGSTKYSKVIL